MIIVLKINGPKESPKNSVHHGDTQLKEHVLVTLTSKTPRHKLIKYVKRGDWLAFRGSWCLGRPEHHPKKFPTLLLSLSFYTSKNCEPTPEPWELGQSHPAQGMSSAPTFLHLWTKVSGEPGGPSSASQEALLQFQGPTLENVSMHPES